MIERQTRNLILPQCCSQRSFCLVSRLRVWYRTGGEGAVGGLEICCGVRAVHHTPSLGDSTYHSIAPSTSCGWAELSAGSVALNADDLERITSDRVCPI